MLVRNQFGKEFLLGTFATVVMVPSGHAGINFSSEGGAERHNAYTCILDETFDAFVKRWQWHQKYGS